MPAPSRYQRQALLEPIGEAGQRRLGRSSALVVGCGALGTVAAELLARAGVGRLVIVDRDVVELTNLHRQVLFDEADASESLPKAEAARRKLEAINADIAIEAHVADFTAAAEPITAGVDVIVDGTDNFETRFLLNDLAVKRSTPYIYAGAVGTRGTMQVVLPRSAEGATAWEAAGIAGPCLRCLVDAGAGPGAGGPSCDTVGVLGPLTAAIAAMQAAEAIKLLVGDLDAVSRDLLAVDLWTNGFRRIDASAMADPDCPCCAHRRFDYLEGGAGSSTAALCGRNAVQVSPESPGRNVDFAAVADRLAGVGVVDANRFTLKATIEAAGRSHELTLFRDGRAIIANTEDPALARSLYSRYVGL